MEKIFICKLFNTKSQSQIFLKDIRSPFRHLIIKLKKKENSLLGLNIGTLLIKILTTKEIENSDQQKTLKKILMVLKLKIMTQVVVLMNLNFFKEKKMLELLQFQIRGEQGAHLEGKESHQQRVTEQLQLN